MKVCREWREWVEAREVLGRSKGQAGGEREGGAGGGREVSLEERSSSLVEMSICFCVRSLRVAVAVDREAEREESSGAMEEEFEEMICLRSFRALAC